MSIKHKFYRKVLKTENFNIDYNGMLIPCKRVYWAVVAAITSRTIKTKHIGLTTYVGSVKFTGISAYIPHKLVSLNIKNSDCSKYFNTSFDRSLGQAYRNFILGDDTRCKNLTGVVQWFNSDSGSVLVNGQVYRVYACNIKGAKTWYNETACMYLKQGELVTVDLKDMGDHLTCRVTSGEHFDSKKWDGLDHSKLAFKCDDNGKALNGLFEK